MKKYLLPILAPLLCFFSCTTEHKEMCSQPIEALQTDPHIVPVDEALGHLNDMLEVLSSGTRAVGAFNHKTIENIAVSGGSQATRSGEESLPDTMLYVVNFANDQGFAILGAQRNLDPVYAITELGSFDPAKMNAAIATAQQNMQRAAMETATRGMENPEASEEYRGEVEEIGPDIVYHLIAEATVRAPRISMEVLSVSYGPWIEDTTTTVGPLVLVKWDQKKPFSNNMHLHPPLETCPFPPLIYMSTVLNPIITTPPDNLAGLPDPLTYVWPIGCGPIAMAQVMATMKIPPRAPAGNTSYSWYSIISVSNYTNLELFNSKKPVDNLPPALQTSLGELTDFLARLSATFKAFKVELGTGVDNYFVMQGLKSLSSFYATVHMADFAQHKEEIYNTLNISRPLYITGVTSNSKGHAWVLDGYVKCSRKVTKKISYGPGFPTMVQTSIENSKMLHFNWGYRGYFDGYFLEGICDMSKRQYRDEQFDQKDHNDENDNNYESQTTSDYSSHVSVMLY